MACCSVVVDDAFASKVVNQRDGRTDNDISFFGIASVNGATSCSERMPHSAFELFIMFSSPEALPMRLYC
jgi:hypothetical protein|tara:strand:- start:10856 stop:11065 length:210 start_codon:yes stop_codon:yes gene_type:complete